MDTYAPISVTASATLRRDVHGGDFRMRFERSGADDFLALDFYNSFKFIGIVAPGSYIQGNLIQTRYHSAEQTTQYKE